MDGRMDRWSSVGGWKNRRRIGRTWNKDERTRKSRQGRKEEHKDLQGDRRLTRKQTADCASEGTETVGRVPFSLYLFSFSLLTDTLTSPSTFSSTVLPLSTSQLLPSFGPCLSHTAVPGTRSAILHLRGLVGAGIPALTRSHLPRPQA